MDLYLQFGHGMMGHCSILLPDMPEATVILSPRDLKESQIEKFSNKVIKLGGATLLDPQLYAPHCDHPKLTQHTYWPQDYSTTSFTKGGALKRVIKQLMDLNDKARTNAFIVPGMYCDRVEQTWLSIHDDIVDAALVYSGEKIGTLCLSSETLRFQDQLDELLVKTEEWDLDGYYVIAEHPNGDYLVEDPVWLTNLLSFCAGLKLQKKKVILGYSNHQMLCCACAGVDAIASGTWMNVRSFTVSKFYQNDPDDIKRKRTWYYCPQALSEVKPEFLDLAFNRSVLQSFVPLPKYGSNYADMLFSGAIPTTTNYNEQTSFRHYLTCLYNQCKLSTQANFSAAIKHQKEILKNANRMIAFAHKYGVRGQKRDFADYVDVNLSAVETFEAEKGFLLKRMWK